MCEGRERERERGEREREVDLNSAFPMSMYEHERVYI